MRYKIVITDKFLSIFDNEPDGYKDIICIPWHSVEAIQTDAAYKTIDIWYGERKCLALSSSNVKDGQELLKLIMGVTE